MLWEKFEINRSPFHQVPMRDGEYFSKYESWRVGFLVDDFFMLSLLKDVMNLLLEGLDMCNQLLEY
jgi:hypothetical protein